MRSIKQVFTGFARDQCSLLAAAISYYTVFALPPLLYLLLTVVTLGLSVVYEGPAAQIEARRLIEDNATQLLGNAEASQAIAAIMEGHQESGGKWWKTLLSFGAVLFGATGAMNALQKSLNRVWGVRPSPERSAVSVIAIKRLLSLGMILGLGVLLVLSLIVSLLLAALDAAVENAIGMEVASAANINFAVQSAVALVVFAAIFRFMPDARVAWKDVLIGALVTTLLFLLGRFGMQAFFEFKPAGAQLTSAATTSVAVIMVWVYYTAMIVLLGAEITQVGAARFGREIRPEKGAVRVVEKIEVAGGDG